MRISLIKLSDGSEDGGSSNLKQLFSTCKQLFTILTRVIDRATMIFLYFAIHLDINDALTNESYFDCLMPNFCSKTAVIVAEIVKVSIYMLILCTC